MNNWSLSRYEYEATCIGYMGQYCVFCLHYIEDKSICFNPEAHAVKSLLEIYVINVFRAVVSSVTHWTYWWGDRYSSILAKLSSSR